MEIISAIQRQVSVSSTWGSLPSWSGCPFSRQKMYLQYRSQINVISCKTATAVYTWRNYSHNLYKSNLQSDLALMKITPESARQIFHSNEWLLFQTKLNYFLLRKMLRNLFFHLNLIFAHCVAVCIFAPDSLQIATMCACVQIASTKKKSFITS